MAQNKELDAILDRMTRMDEVEMPTDLKACIFGVPGHGKTTQLMKLAQSLKKVYGGRILFVDSGDGWVSIKDNPRLKADVEYIRVIDPADLPQIIEGVKNGYGPLKGIKTVVLDEWTTWMKRVLQDAQMERLGLTNVALLPEPIGADYQVVTAIGTKLIGDLEELQGIHLLFGAHAREKFIRTIEDNEYKLDLTPMLLKEFQSKMHLTSFIQRRHKLRGDEYVLVTQPTELIGAKTRIENMDSEYTTTEYLKTVVQWISSGTTPESKPPAPAEGTSAASSSEQQSK